MKTIAIETIRLIEAALDTRDALRRLAAAIDAASVGRHVDDHDRQAEMLKTARAVATTYADLLRGALKDSAARRHNPAIADTPLWGGRAKGA
jgi:hypothetical protein